MYFVLALLVPHCFLPLSVVYVLDSLFSIKMFTSLNKADAKTQERLFLIRLYISVPRVMQSV